VIAGKTDAVKAWLETWPGLDGYLKLNAVEMTPGEFSVQTVFNDSFRREFIGGKKERIYTFALVLVADWSSGFDDVNAEANKIGEEWLDWVDRQYAEGNLPDFGDASIRKIQSVQNVPGLSAVYDEDMTAQYMFQAAITYWE